MRPKDGNAQGIFTVPSVYDLPDPGHTLRQDDKRGPLHGTRFPVPGRQRDTCYAL